MMATNGAPGNGDGDGSGSTAEPGLWPLILRHRRASATVAAIAVLAIGLSVVPGLVGSGGGPLSDATTCSQWSAASSAQRSAYVQLYLESYGSFSGAGRTSAAVQTTITHGCVRAAFLGEADDVSVLAAVHGDF
jgi:hypothetical protein